MTSDLEEVLQQNLELRHELAIEVAKAVEPVPLSGGESASGGLRTSPCSLPYWSFLSQLHPTSFCRQAFSCFSASAAFAMSNAIRCLTLFSRKPETACLICSGVRVG
jgi:hypothetical protein